jgi:hypothetical protein
MSPSPVAIVVSLIWTVLRPFGTQILEGFHSPPQGYKIPHRDLGSCIIVQTRMSPSHRRPHQSTCCHRDLLGAPRMLRHRPRPKFGDDHHRAPPHTRRCPRAHTTLELMTLSSSSSQWCRWPHVIAKPAMLSSSPSPWCCRPHRYASFPPWSHNVDDCNVDVCIFIMLMWQCVGSCSAWGYDESSLWCCGQSTLLRQSVKELWIDSHPELSIETSAVECFTEICDISLNSCSTLFLAKRIKALGTIYFNK